MPEFNNIAEKTQSANLFNITIELIMFIATYYISMFYCLDSVLL